MPYVDNVPHAGSAEVLFTGMYDEPAGTIARTIPRGVVSNANLIAFNTSGQVAVRMIPLPAGMVVSNLAFLLGSTGATGPTHLWLALADAQLNIQAVTADQLAAAQTANAFTKVPLLIPYVIPYTGLFAFMTSSSSSTTAPTAGGASLGAAATPTIPPILCGFAGNQATPPAAGTQLNGGVVNPNTNANLAAWLS